MFSHLLISVISDDKPGVVEAIAEAVSTNGGNWLESRLSQLGGKFAGVIRISSPSEAKGQLQAALESLQAQEIWIKIEQASSASSSQEGATVAYVHALGPDRPGIVKELSKALAKSHINLANLETKLSSMPYSGEPLFEASGQLEIPKGVDLQELDDTLHSIADALALDISLLDEPFEG